MAQTEEKAFSGTYHNNRRITDHGRTRRFAVECNAGNKEGICYEWYAKLIS